MHQARALLQNDQLDLALQTAKQAFEQQRTQELQQVQSAIPDLLVLRRLQLYTSLPFDDGDAFALFRLLKCEAPACLSVHLSVCLSDRMAVCSVLRYHVTVH